MLITATYDLSSSGSLSAVSSNLSANFKSEPDSSSTSFFISSKSASALSFSSLNAKDEEIERLKEENKQLLSNIEQLKKSGSGTGDNSQDIQNKMDSYVPMLFLIVFIKSV